MRASAPIDWGETIRQIVGDWLFSDLADEGLPPVGVLPLENPDLYNHDATCRGLTNRRSHRTVTIGEHGGTTICVFRSKFGGAAAGMLVDAASDRGLKSLIAVGYCGGLIEEFRTGEIVAVSKGLGDDGTSEAYAGDVAPAPEPGIYQLLLDLLSAEGPRCHQGPVWSTDAVLLENDRKVQEWRAAGAIAVDMEARAVLSVARYARLSACVLLVVSDNPAARLVADPENLSRGWNGALSVAFGVASRVGSQNRE